MVDGSSDRLLRRLLSLQSSKPAHSDKELINTVASLIPEDRPKEFNLALLDIAAAFCKPTRPSCQICPLFDVCKYAGLSTHGGPVAASPLDPLTSVTVA